MTVNMTFDELSPTFLKDLRHPFEDVDRWKMIDMKLGQALLTMVRGVGVDKHSFVMDILARDRLTIQATAADGRRVPMGGRQNVRLMLEYYQTHESLTQMFGWASLSSLTWRGDSIDQMNRFLNEYRSLRASLKSSIPDEAVIIHLHRCVEQSKVLQPDVREFERLRRGY